MKIRNLVKEDLKEVTRIDSLQTGVSKRAYWDRVFRDFLDRSHEMPHFGVVAESEKGLAGYVLGEVRAFEFGSEACGWIFSIAVDPSFARTGIASLLLAEVCRRFHRAGAHRVRTMVQRRDVPVLSFFRSNGFVGGSYVQLELDLEVV